VRPGCVQRHDAVPDGAAVDSRADLTDCPGAQVADDMWHRGRLGRRAGEEVAALDADRLGIDHDEAVRALRLGNVFVAK